MDKVFTTDSANWRGIGVVPQSGLQLKQEYQRFDAGIAFPVVTKPVKEAKGCICGDILRGVKTPLQCQLFRQVCTPEQPVGPCMVSSEGACAAYYYYGDNHG